MLRGAFDAGMSSAGTSSVGTVRRWVLGRPQVYEGWAADIKNPEWFTRRGHSSVPRTLADRPLRWEQSM
jgi:hypothetical protein